MSTTLSRRTFLQTAALAGVSMRLTSAARCQEAPSNRIRVGVIGIAGQGAYNLTQAAKAGAEIVALCDVHESRPEVAQIRALHPQASFHTDFRKLLDQKGIDAVLISTPDHTHAVATVAALQSGRHVYCEKPLTHTVSEARIVAETAARTRRVTQMGTQIHAGNNYRRCVEIIQAGVIGPVAEVHVWCGASRSGGDRPAETPPVPPGLDFDLWLGPAPVRPYHPAYVPFHWRGWWDFGGGALADMACHYCDLPFWALKLRHPTTVAADGPPPHPEAAARELTVHYEFPAREGLPPVKLTWYDGGRRPTHFAMGILPQWGDGVLFVGSKGMLLADYNKHRLLPEKDFQGFVPPAPSIPNSIGHHREWLEAIKSNGPTTCNFDYSGALTEAVLLGNVAYRLRRPITWDARSLKAVNDPEADRYVQHHYRQGWSL